MFTGIVTHAGEVKKARRSEDLLRLEIEALPIARELDVGDSIAVNGVCLTAVSVARPRFEAEVVPETLARTTLAHLDKGARVNLELPARPTDRLGGHIVQGHVDGIAEVVRIEDEGNARRVWFTAPVEVLRYLVHKGSVALDGVSLTVAEVGRTTFQVALIPHTLDNTTLGAVEVGSQLNTEVDVVAKYVERLLEPHAGKETR
jgi:riboflavin synthase